MVGDVGVGPGGRGGLVEVLLQRLSGTLLVSRPWVNFAPPSASRPPVPDGGREDHREARATAPRQMIGSTRSSCWPDSFDVGARRGRELLAGVGRLVLRLGDRPGRPGCRAGRRGSAGSGTQPTMPTTSAESSTVLATTRAWTERRQKVSARRTRVRQSVDRTVQPRGRRMQAGHGARTWSAYAVPALYPTPRTVTTISGFSGSCSTLDRSRCTWTLTSRVSALWR